MLEEDEVDEGQDREIVKDRLVLYSSLECLFDISSLYKLCGRFYFHIYLYIYICGLWFVRIDCVSFVRCFRDTYSAEVQWDRRNNRKLQEKRGKTIQEMRTSDIGTGLGLGLKLGLGLRLGL